MKSKILLMACVFVMALGSVSNVVAAETVAVGEEEIPVERRGEVTEYRYKVVDGIMYKRLWSITRNCWVDPYWTRV